MRKNKGTGDGVHRNDEYTVDLSGAIGANSQQEIREHFKLTVQEMTLLWAQLSYLSII